MSHDEAKRRRQEAERRRQDALRYAYDTCACGQPKAKQAKRCQACHLAAVKTNSQVCECGKPKSRKAKLCIHCTRSR